MSQGKKTLVETDKDKKSPNIETVKFLGDILERLHSAFPTTPWQKSISLGWRKKVDSGLWG